MEIRHDAILHHADTLRDTLSDITTLAELKKYVPEDVRFEVAFLDQHKHILYSTFHTPVLLFPLGYTHYQNHYFYLDTLELKHLSHIHYLVLRTRGIEPRLEETRRNVSLFLLFSILFLAVVIYLLGNLFLQPVRHAIEKLDHFIRDTTHELNTPLSVITMSIEQLNALPLDPIQSKHIQRINIASRTISNLYNDLAFLLMYEQTKSQNVEIPLVPFIEERVDYFRPLAQAKKITVHLDLHDLFLPIDREKLTRIIDNLLSNAIKYNKPFGSITITLMSAYLSIEDTGIGIPQEKIAEIFNRYSRFDEANGGFGIGLNIVQLICREYHFSIEVQSTMGEGTVFRVMWDKASHSLNAV